MTYKVEVHDADTNECTLLTLDEFIQASNLNSPALMPVTVGVAVAAAVTNDTSVVMALGCTVARTNVGRWSVSFAAATSASLVVTPDGPQYGVSLTSVEDSSNRDTPYVTLVEDSLTAEGFDVQITKGDNGGNADTYVDAGLHVLVLAPASVMMPIPGQ